MKNIFVAIIFLLPLFSFGQITHTDSVNHTTITTYLGALSGPQISTENGKISGFTYLRGGGMVTWNPSEQFSFFGLGVGEIDQTGTVSPFALFGTKFSPSKIISITAGKIGTPMTELRPLPTTGSGQFETWTQAQILGSALGGKIRLNASKKVYFTAGEFVRGNTTSTEIGIGLPHTQIAGYYILGSKTFGGAVNFNYKILSTTLSYNDGLNTGMRNVLEIPKTNGLFIYSDIGFTTKGWKMVRGEWGIFKTFSAKSIKSLLGVGWSEEVNALKGYIFLHL